MGFGGTADSQTRARDPVSPFRRLPGSLRPPSFPRLSVFPLVRDPPRAPRRWAGQGPCPAGGASSRVQEVGGGRAPLGRRVRGERTRVQPCSPSPRDPAEGLGAADTSSSPLIPGDGLCGEPTAVGSPSVSVTSSQIPQSVVPGPSPAFPGLNGCGWQKPGVGLASYRSRRKVGRVVPWLHSSRGHPHPISGSRDPVA